MNGKVSNSKIYGYVLQEGIVEDGATVQGWQPLYYTGYVGLLHIEPDLPSKFTPTLV